MKSLKTKQKQNYINHVAFVIDMSGSMIHHKSDVVKVFEEQLSNLAKQAKLTDQETRVSIYLFSDTVKCIAYDKSVGNVTTIGKAYKPAGNTALIDGAYIAINDFLDISESSGDHAFLIYVITDGAENASSATSGKLKTIINSCPDNWTLAVLVPDRYGLQEAIRYGFPEGNISIWDADSDQGITDVGYTLANSISDYYSFRSQGQRSTRTLFKPTTPTARSVIKNLEPLHKSLYKIIVVNAGGTIRDVVEKYTKLPYRVGSTFYELLKPEVIQANKQICVYDVENDIVYAGSEARKVLNLPDYEIKVCPADYSNFEIYVQSGSVNRKILSRSTILVMT